MKVLYLTEILEFLSFDWLLSESLKIFFFNKRSSKNTFSGFLYLIASNFHFMLQLNLTTLNYINYFIRERSANLLESRWWWENEDLMMWESRWTWPLVCTQMIFLFLLLQITIWSIKIVQCLIILLEWVVTRGRIGKIRGWTTCDIYTIIKRQNTCI